jgi:hypothetical protein
LANAGVDLQVDASGIVLSSSFIVAGDRPWANTTVRNFGDTPADATLDYFLGDPSSSEPVARANFSIGADTTALVAATIDTAGLEGIRSLTVRLAGITPVESGASTDNAASVEVRIHARFGEVDLTGTQVAYINATYPRTAFVTVRDDAALTIGPAGNLSIGQLFANQFDIRVEGRAILRVAGGAVGAALPLRLVLADNATLIVEDGSAISVSVRSTSAGVLRFGGARLTAEEIAVQGSAIEFDGTQVQVQRADFSAASFAARGSTFEARETIRFRGGSQAAFIGTSVAVSSEFASGAEADLAFPGISRDLQPFLLPFQPALHWSQAATGNLTRSAVVSQIRIAGVLHGSSVPLVADDGARVTLQRIARVEVSDPTGAPVLNATVQVFDYLANSTLIASSGAPDGVAEMELDSEVLENGAPHFVGTYLIVASKASTVSPSTPLTFPLYPELGGSSIVTDIQVMLPLFSPWGLYPEDIPPLKVAAATSLSGEVLWTSSVEIRAPLSLEGAGVTLAQSRDFERYIVVTDGGSIAANASLIQSNFAFNLYVLNGSGLDLNGGGIVHGNLLLWNAGDVRFVGSRLVGSAIGRTYSVELQESFVWARAIDLDATDIRLQDAVLAARDQISLQASTVALARVGLAGRFAPFDAPNRTTLSLTEFQGVATGTFEGLLDAPTIAVSGGHVEVMDATLWTTAGARFSPGPVDSAMVGISGLTWALAFVLQGANLDLRGLSLPEAALLSLEGAGKAWLRETTAAPPTVAAGVTAYLYTSVAVGVVDEVGLPVPGATVLAAPLSSGADSDLAVTDERGMASLDLLASTITSSSVQAGPNYRVNATRGSAVSPSATWAPESSGMIVLALPGILAPVEASAYFAVLVPLGGASYRVVASNVPDEPSLVTFLQSFGLGAVELNFTAPLVAGQSAEGYAAADYLYREGGSSAARPMADGSVKFSTDEGAPSTVVLDDEGQGRLSIALPAAAGSHTLGVEVAAPGLSAPWVTSAAFNLASPPKLVVTSSKVKSSLNASESMILIGQVTFADGAPAPFSTITITYAPGKAPRVNITNEGGNYFVMLVAPASQGSYNVTIVASRANALSSDPLEFVYAVRPAGNGRPTTPGGEVNVLALLAGGAIFAACLVFFALALAQRRAARGAFVECGNCGQLTLAADKQCRHCGVEFESSLAKCSRCQTWIPASAIECPQCHAVFATRPDREPVAPDAPASPVADFAPPAHVVNAARRAPPAHLENLEFRLPGTTETVELGEKGGAPAFPSGSLVAPAPHLSSAMGPASAQRPLERVELPHHEEPPSPVREVSAIEGGSPVRREPVSLGTGNVDLSKTTAAATSTKTSANGVPAELTDEVLRELLLRAAPELSADVLPGDIRKQLQDIAQGEAQVAAEKRTAGAAAVRPKRAGGGGEERAVEAPEKSKRSAFEVFQTPAKNVPAGFEKRGGTPAKEAPAKGGAAPVCPNCGGNWVVQRDGKNSCRVCGTRW